MAQELIDKIRAAAQASNIDPDVAVRIAQAESALNPAAQAKTSSAKGLFQVIDSTWKQYGGKPGQQKNPDENIRVGMNILADNTSRLRSALGREPSASELYAAHFFGPGTAPAVLSASPDTPISDLLSQRAVKANPQLQGKTAGEVRQMLQAKMGETPAAKPKAAPSDGKEGQPDFEAIGRGQMTADLGSGYKAALALSFLSDEEDSEERKLDEEEKQAAKQLADYKSFNALEGLNFGPSVVPLMPQQTAQAPDQVPVQRLAAGGMPFVPTAMVRPSIRQQLTRAKADFDRYNAEADAYNKAADAYNASGQQEDFLAKEPVAPTMTAEQYEAQAKAARTDASRRNMALQIAADPERFGLSMNRFFADGGEVTPDAAMTTNQAILDRLRAGQFTPAPVASVRPPQVPAGPAGIFRRAIPLVRQALLRSRIPVTPQSPMPPAGMTPEQNNQWVLQQRSMGQAPARLLADGGEVEGKDLPDLPGRDDVNFIRSANKQKIDGKDLENLMLGVGFDRKAIVGANLSRMSEGERDNLARSLMAAYNTNFGDLGVNAAVIRPIDAPSGVYMGTLGASYPLGQGRIMGGVNALRTPDQGTQTQGYTLGYAGKVGPGFLEAQMMQPKDFPQARMGRVQYRIPFADGGEVSGFGSSTPVIPEQMAPGGAMMLADGGEVDGVASQMLKQVVPMDIRTFGSTLFGSRDPITEKNFTADELAAMQKAVDTAAKRTGQTQKGSVQYVDYPRGEQIGPDFKPVGQTLGRFTYEKQPDGTTVVRDRYDFYNEGRKGNVEAYEKMGRGERALTVSGRALKNLVTGNLRGIPDELADAYIGREGRDVTIKLPPVRRADGGSADPTPEELAAASRPATFNPQIARQGAAARRLAAMRDVNTLPDPRTYAAVSGFLGTPPDQQGFSVMHPDLAGIKKAGEAGFYAGTATQVAPVVGSAAKMLGKLTGSALNERMLAGQSLTPGFNTPSPVMFAVKPRGGTVLYTQTGEGGPLPISKLDELMMDYRVTAARDQDASDDLVNFIKQKAPKYFTTTFGTADDPLRTAIRERAIEPFGRDVKKIPPYLVDAAKFPQARGHLQAKQELERLYDEMTGVDPLVLRPETGAPSLSQVQRSINQKMAQEGVPVEAQNAPSVTGFMQSEFAEYPYGTERLRKLVAAEQQLPSGIQHALRTGEPMYDINPNFDLFDPRNVVDALKQIPSDKLKKMSFPEALIQGTQALAPVRDYRAAVEMAERGAKLPPAVLQRYTEPVAPAPGGQWVQITNPVGTELEGKLMKHSVGGYSTGDTYGTGYTGLPYGGKMAFDDGLVRVFSLRDKEGLPTITVEMAKPKGQEGWNVTQVRGRFNSEPQDRESVFNLFDKIDSTEGLNRIKTNSYTRSAAGEDLEQGSMVDWGREYDQWKQGISE